MSNQENIDEMKAAHTAVPCLKFLNLFADIKGFPQTQQDLSDSLLNKRNFLPHCEIIGRADTSLSDSSAVTPDRTQAPMRVSPSEPVTYR